MPTPKKGPRLGGSPSHQRHILSNLCNQLIEHRSITTTVAKAKALQPMFEKLVTKARRGTLHDRRMVVRKLRNKDSVYELFDVLVPEIDAERVGGYTRITPIGNRKGDNAPMAVIEVITEPVMKKAVVKDATKTAKAAVKEESAAPVEKADTDEVDKETAEESAE